MTYFVDAHSGTILRESNNLRELYVHKAGTHADLNFDSTTAIRIPKTLEILNILRLASLQSNNRGMVYPERATDTPVLTGLKSEVELFNSIGQQVAWGTDANGHFSYSGLAVGNYVLEIPLRSTGVRVFSGGTNNNPFEHSVSLSLVGSHAYNHAWSSGDATASTVFYHATQMHDFIKGSPFNYNGMDFHMGAHILGSSGECPNACASGNRVVFTTNGGVQWGRSSDVVYHEYTHNTIYKLYGNNFIGYSNGQCGNPMGCGMDEGFSDYFAATINNHSVIGEDVGVNRNLNNGLIWGVHVNENDNPHRIGEVIGGAAWRLRQAVGATVRRSLNL